MHKTVSLKHIFFVILLVTVFISITLKHCISVKDIETAKETVEVVRDVYSVTKFAKNVKDISNAVEETQTVTTTTTTSNEEPDSSEYYKYYTKEQLTELKKHCYPTPVKDGVREYHAIDQSVKKWGGVPFREFMDLFKRGKEYSFPKKPDQKFLSTEEWTSPLVYHNGILKPKTIFRTNGRYLIEYYKQIKK